VTRRRWPRRPGGAPLGTCALAACALGACALLGTAACSRPSASDVSVAPAASSAGAATAAPANAAASGVARAATVRPWHGTYTARAGEIYVPEAGDAPNAKEWDGVKWRGDATDAGLGDGTLTLGVDGAGRVTGTLDGPLGPATVSGVWQDDRLTASFAPKTPSPTAFSGSLTAATRPDGAEGVLHASMGTARVIRTGTLRLEPAHR
jgi:hypothetical protein